MRTGGTPLVLDHQNIVGHAQATGLHPLFDLLVKAEDRIWALLLEPAVEKRLLLADSSENRLQDGVWVFLNRRSYYFALVVVDGCRRADR